MQASNVSPPRRGLWLRRAWIGLALLTGVASMTGAAAVATNRVVVQRDFRIFDYYRGSQRLKTLLHGGEAEYLLHPIPVHRMTIQTYTESGLTNLIATADDCFCDRTNRTANGAGPVQFRLADGRFQLSGVGFLWAQTNNILVVSNQVRSRLRGDLLQPRLPTP
jgi:hypothetical protein